MLQVELKESKAQLAAVTDSITKLDLVILSQQIDNESARELGPLKYMAQLTGQGMDKIVNWFMILIIFVFDPLAIAMVVAANVAFAKIRPKQVKVEMSKPSGLEFDTPYTLEEIKEKWVDETDTKEYIDTQIEILRNDLNNNNIMSHNQGTK